MQDIYQSAFTRSIFDRMSRSYDHVNNLTSFGFVKRWRRQLIDKIPAGCHPARTLDLATGPGEMWHPIVSRFPDTELTAIEFSPAMMELARKRNQDCFNDKVTLLPDDVLTRSFEDQHYDLVTCSFGLKHFSPDQVAQLGQITHDLLKPGGRFAFIEVSRPGNPLLRFCFFAHLRFVVPNVGRLFGRYGEFRMLWRYTDSYKDSTLAALNFRDAGLEVEYDSYFGGCATGFHGRKP